MEVYRCQSADIRAVLAALRKVEGGDALGARKPDVEWFLKDSANHFYLAVEEDEPVGYLIAYALQRIDRKEVMTFCYQLIVQENYRRRGVGLALLCAIISHCEMNGVMKLFAVVDAKNEAAMGLFRKAGGKAIEGAEETTFCWGG